MLKIGKLQAEPRSCIGTGQAAAGLGQSDFSNRRVLVTGGAGYIGSHTCKALAEAGLEPITFDNLSTGHRWAVRWGPLIQGDLRDVDSIARVLDECRPGAVIHFAASAYVGESMMNPRKYFDNNIRGSLNLLDAMLDAGVDRIVFSSSCATYGIPERIPIPEDDPQRPISPYGESKLLIESALKWYARAYGLRWVALRYFNAAGADAQGMLGEHHDPETHLIPLVIGAALGTHRPVHIFGEDYGTADGTCVRDYIHVEDLGTGHLMALRAAFAMLSGSGLAVNLGTGRGHSVLDVIRSVERVSGRTVPRLIRGRRDGDPDLLVADSSRALEAIGWRPRYIDLDEIVGTAWKWHARAASQHLLPTAVPDGCAF